MSPLLGGHLHLARDSHIVEDEEIVTPLVRLSKGLDLGDFIRAPSSSHCLRRSVGSTSLVFTASGRSQSPGLQHVLRPGPGGPGSPRGTAGTAGTASPRLSQREKRPGGSATLNTRPSPSPHFWQPWSAREVKSPVAGASSPRVEAKHSPGRSATLRGRSPRSPTTAGHSPKSSPSPDTSRSPSAGPGFSAARRPVVAAGRRSRGLGSPRAASPFNPHTDYDIHLDLPSGAWYRFETRVGVADESKWPGNARAKFQVIEDDKTLLWESSETLELWAPTELCSVLMSGDRSSSPRGTKHLCLRVRCSSPPEGALWLEPVLSRRSAAALVATAPRRAVPWEEMLAGEMLMEIVSRLSCRDVARLLACFKQPQMQPAWHCAFAHGFRQAYLRYFLGPLRKPATLNGNAGLGIQWLGGAPQNGNFTFTPFTREPLSPRLPAASAAASAAPGAPGAPRPAPVARPVAAGRGVMRSGRMVGKVSGLQLAACCNSCRRSDAQLPQWAAEVFDWRQICRRFFLAQLPYANVNFQLFNCSTPNGFDSGEILHVPRAYHGQSPNFRCGWNIPLSAVHFQSQPSPVVVAHRSPLGVAGVPPSVATVRGTAGPEPTLAMTLGVSERDSAVILPMALPGQLKLQWTLEVEPGRYLVVVTVGDRHVGFAAHLEVAGFPIFSGEWAKGPYLYGHEIPFGESVVFRHEGCLEGRMTLYNVSRTGCKLDHAWILELDKQFPPMASRPHSLLDFGFHHDVLCGLGGFSSACAEVSIKTVSAVDWTPLSAEMYRLNHKAPMIQGDINCPSTIFRMHQLQLECDSQPLITAGTPCQALSCQGYQLGHLDARSTTLPAVLRAAFFLGSVGLTLECVPQALEDPSTQKALREYAELCNCLVHQKILKLCSVWPCRRSRWFATITPKQYGFAGFLDLPVLQPMPALQELFPFDPWPTWSDVDEAQLRWTPLELEVYRNPLYGPVNRKPNMQEPCPTALHSWGNALYPCPCGCRSQGLSANMLRSKGLRGIEVCSGTWPHHARHLHPKELQLILAFPPIEAVHADARAHLAMFGNSVSPIHGLWIFCHLLDFFGLSANASPRVCLRDYLVKILHQRDLTWPSPGAGVASLSLCHQGSFVDITFNTTQTVGDLLRAEAQLSGHADYQIRCEGLILPSWAFLQARSYSIDLISSELDNAVQPVPVIVEHLGSRSLYFVPDGLKYGSFLQLIGIPEAYRLVDSDGLNISPGSDVEAWRTVTVQMSPEDVEFELSVRLAGFGPSDSVVGSLHLSHSCPCTGLWHFDQIVKSDLLLSWAGAEYVHFACWLPSFAEAIIELWPSVMEEHIQAWLRIPCTRIFAIVYDARGWNLVRFDLSPDCLLVTFYEEEHLESCNVHHLAYRVRSAAARPQNRVAHEPSAEHAMPADSLAHVLCLVDHSLDLPPVLVQALSHARAARLQKCGSFLDESASITATLPYTSTLDQQMPILGAQLRTAATCGLTANFLLNFARALTSCADSQLDANQVKVICPGLSDPLSPYCSFQDFSAACTPLWIFFLVDHHWTLLLCKQEADALSITQYDGMALTSLSALSGIAAFLKQSWNLRRVTCHTTWTFQQTRSDSCGTIALAHFAYHAGLITFDQAQTFEQLHDSLAICGSMLHCRGPTGFGPDEAAIIGTLEQILPSKGVPVAEVANRAKAAIKVFGVKAIHQTLQSTNQWAALKTLGNSKPKPFMWVTHQELQLHIQERAQSKFGAVDLKKPRKQPARREQTQPKHLDPASLVLPPGLFTTNCGTALPQLAIGDVQRDSRGVAFASVQEAQHFLSDGKMISAEGLALLVVGPMDLTSVALPMHSIRVPAIYKGTNEPIILDCTSIQLGDQAVYRRSNQDAPELTVCPTKVVRVHTFKELIDNETSWEEFIEHPVRYLVQAFPVLRMCKDSDCDHSCGLFHPSLEEEGVESGLLDIWSFRWHGLDGSKQPPAKAEVLSVYIRIPESSFDTLHLASGAHGAFFEPRNADQPGPDEVYAVVWTPQWNLGEVLHRVRTVDHCLAACRLGTKYGIRCLSKHHEALHSLLHPTKPFVPCAIKEIYRLEPLPAGTQRASLVATLQSFGWNAKPLQPCKGSQGKAWQVGAATAPPHQLIEAQHGWIGITKVKDATPPVRTSGLIATAKTKQHIQENQTAASSSSSTADPWQQGPDPWGGWKPSTKTPSVPTHHVQSRFDDVENRLQQHVTNAITKEVEKMQLDPAANDRLAVVENQLQSLADNQTKLEHWISDGGTKMHSLQQECAQLHNVVQTQGQTLQHVASEVSHCTTSLQTVTREVCGLKDGLTANLDAYFTKQQNAFEAMLAKRQHSFIDAPPWLLQSDHDFVLGLFNPSGLSNKFHQIDHMPAGWWHVAETQASKYQQCAFQGYLGALSHRSGRLLRSTLGAPAALRPGSSTAGSWTGVLSFGDCPLRQVSCAWPSGEFESGRVLLSCANIHGLELLAATVYLPPKGPTYPNATSLSEALLTPVTAELVLGRSGPRAILGDMNCSPGALEQMAVWKSAGWVELQDLFCQMHGFSPQNTCKQATRPDQIWVSPELACLVVDIAIWNIFPDHSAVLAGLRLPVQRISELQWRLPGHVPWDQLDVDKWNSMPSIGPVFRPKPAPVGCAGLDSNLADQLDFRSPSSASVDFHRWSKAFEQQVSQCIASPVGRADKSYFGRGSQTKPKIRRLQPPVPKYHRPGEIAQASGFLNRAVSAWYKQLRRLQSYNHAVKSQRASETYQSRAALWHSILVAHGFKGGFQAWWISRPFQYQGAPRFLPSLPPDGFTTQLIFEDFSQNYRRFEHWQLQRRKDSCRSKLVTTMRNLFQATRKPAKPYLDALVDSHSQAIQVCDTVENLVSVPVDFPDHSILHWTLQDLPARVTKVDSLYRIDTDLVLASGQQLACHQLVADTETIHQRLIQLWSPRWNKHSEVPSSAWDQACQYATETLPPGNILLPDISIQDFRRAVGKFKAHAATGPCGWSRNDLLHLTDQQAQQLIDGFHSVERGSPWPQQWCVGLVNCLQKKDSSVSVDGFRPITVMSMFYRVFAGIRAGQILSQMSCRAEFLQCGFMKGHRSADVWYFIGVCLELAACQSAPVHGLVADLVKAYNTLPRRPAFHCLSLLGVPDWFLSSWQAHLSDFRRFFVVRRCTSDPILSATGFPEGCPLACTAMAALDFFWHWAIKLRVPRALPVSFVDNLELVCDRLCDLYAAAETQEHFCTLLDLDLDLPRLFAWSSTPTGRQALKQKGYRVSLSERDLGGQVTYCRKLRNNVLTDRIAGTLPYFDRLRKAALPLMAKIMNIRQTLFPRALHGCEAVVVGTAHFDKLRTGVMKALKWSRKGASPLVRLSLLHVELDPSWYQLWQSVLLFREQCTKNQAIRDWWKIFCGSCDVTVTHGPFGKLRSELHALGLILDADGHLWFSANGYIDIFLCTDQHLRHVLQVYYQDTVATRVAMRKGYEDLEGFDYTLTVSSDHLYNSAETEQLMTVRDGTFFTSSTISKFDARQTARCQWCNALDTKEHRYETCSKYDHLRAQHQELFDIWEQLPRSFRLSGLVPRNPWKWLAWEALAALPDLSCDYAFMPTGRVWHVFTDGTCTDPHCLEESLAAWATVVQGKGTLSCGPLPGVLQTILRAEIFAVYSAIQWASGFKGDLHLWVDNQTVVDHLRELLLGVGHFDGFEHRDLWRRIGDLLAVALCDVFIHKVASHTQEGSSSEPHADFARLGNAAADLQASISNQSRPGFFAQVWDRHKRFCEVWRHRVRLLTRMYVDFATFDCVKTVTDDPQTSDEADEVSHFEFCIDVHPNTAQFHVHLLPLLECDWFLSSHDFHFRQVGAKLAGWLISLDQSAAMMRLVSHLELFVCFRRFLGCPVSGGFINTYAALTFAADYKVFRKILYHLLSTTGILSAGTSGHLTVLGIHIPQACIELGFPQDEAEFAQCKLRDFVGNRPIVEAGTFKSRCLICETKYGAITLGQHTSRAWSAGLHKDEMCHLATRLACASDGLLETLQPPGNGSSAASDPPGPGRTAPDALAKGTRLVSIRTAAVSLAREVEKERKASFTEFNGKIADARMRLDALRQAMDAEKVPSLDREHRELHRAAAKLAELQAQKALKLFSLIASSRRVTHPYVYLAGDANATPANPASQG
eukprot:s1799_g3.t2